ncbi:uncharacterized protein LOC135397598 isoform X2 [Ornithodoros turicata]
MNDDQADDHDDVNRLTKKVDIRFTMLSFRYKKRREFEVPPGHNLAQQNQVLGRLEENGGPASLFSFRSVAYLGLFLFSGLVHFGMGLLVSRMIMQHQADSYDLME